MVSHWSLSDNKSSQVSRTLLSMVDLNNAVVWMVFTRPVISKSSSPCTNPLVTIPWAPITISIIITFMFHSFFISLIIFFYLLLESFSHQYELMVFHWSLSDSKSPQVSRTLLSILAVLNNAVVWMVSTHPHTSKSSSLFNSPLVTVLNAPITIGIIVTFMFHSFFSSLVRLRYLSFFSFSFSFILWSTKSTILQVLFFLLITIRSGLLAKIRWSVCMSKSHRSLCVSFSWTAAGLCIYHLFVWSNLNFLHISLWITLPTQSCLVLYSFCDNLLHSFIMWLMVLSLSSHNLHLLFCCI